LPGLLVLVFKLVENLISGGNIMVGLQRQFMRQHNGEINQDIGVSNEDFRHCPKILII
jgi:hypothetical protein